MRIPIWLLLAVSLFLPGLAQATETIGRVKNVEGIAYVQRGYTRILCKPGLALHENDIIRTLDDGKLGLTLNDETAFALGPDTLVRIDSYFFDNLTYDGELEAFVEEGSVAIRTGRLAGRGEPKIRVKTKQSVLGVRGTFFAFST